MDDLYRTLNMFWGRMENNASAIKFMDDNTAAAIGAEYLDDSSSIEAAMDMTIDMNRACTTYLRVLDRQGVQIPTYRRNHPLRLFSNVDTHSPQLESGTCSPYEWDILKGRAELKQKHTKAYREWMRRAVLDHMDAMSANSIAVTGTGMWFDIPSLRSSVSVWISGSQSFSQFVNLTGNIGEISDEAVAGIVQASRSLDGSLDEVRPHVVGMLTHVISLGETIIGWAVAHPEPPTTDAEKEIVEELQARALTTCQEAKEESLLAKNQFAVFNNEAREYQQDLQADITKKNWEILFKKMGAQEEIDSLSPPWYVYFMGPLAVFAWREQEIARIERALNNAVNELTKSINSLKSLQSSGITFEGNALTWIQMVETVSENLGNVYIILNRLRAQLMNPTLYASFIEMGWKELVEDANEVLQLLNVGAHRAMVATVSDKEAVIQAVSPMGTLGPRVKGQATDAQNVFGKLSQLLRMPYASDIIGYWDEGKTKRETLFDVTTSLRTEYVHMVATQYETIQNLYNLSILQKYRAGNVVQGKLALPVFVQATLQSVRGALKAASNTSERFGDSSERFDYIMSVITDSIDTIEAKIASLDDDIEKADEKLRNQIIWIVADVIALAFSTAALLSAFGVIGGAAQAIGLAVKIGATASATASSVKLVLDSLTLSDLAQLIAALKNLRSTLQKSVDNLKVVQPVFKDVVTGVHELTATITDMKQRLEKVSDNLDLLDDISLTQADAEAIMNSWIVVGEDAQEWMDVINAQGISPITFSVKALA